MTPRRLRLQAAGIPAPCEAALLQVHAAMDADALWRATQAVLRAAMPVHFLCLCLKPFDRLPGSIVRDCIQPEIEADFAEYMRLNPAERHLVQHAGLKVLRLSDVVPPARLASSKYYRKHMRPLGYLYFAALSFWRGRAQEGLIGLHRTPGQGDFSDDELRVLGHLYPAFHAAVRRVLRWNRERSARLSLQQVLRGLPLTAVLLDWSGRVLFHNRAAVEAVLRWKHGPGRASGLKLPRSLVVPALVRKRCDAIRRHWQLPLLPAFDLASAPAEVVTHPRWPEMRASIRVLQATNRPGQRPTFLVQFETSPPPGGGVGSFRAMARLTPCERELAGLVREGMDNKEIAAHLGKSVFTVKKQLQSVFRKLEIPTRARLVALLR